VQVSPEVQKRLDDRERCRKEYQYLSEVMGYDFSPAVHQELWDTLPNFDPGKPWAMQSDVKKWLILWPRGHYKTTAIVVAIVRIILNFPDIRILIMQGSTLVTRNLLHEIKSHFTGQNANSQIPHLFPEFCNEKLGNAYRFTVPARKNQGLAQATVTVASPRSIKTGQHYDIFFPDDLVNDQNYRSRTLLQKVKQDFSMCLPLVDPPHYVVMTGTRYAFGDLYEELIRFNKGEWKVSQKTCWTDETATTPRFPLQESKTKPGKVVGFTREGLLLMQEGDPEMFAGQYLNKPIQRGGQSITRLMMEGGLVSPASAPPLSAAHLFVDLATTDNVTSDDSVIICGRHDLQMTPYVVDGRGGKFLTAALAQNVLEMAIIHRPERIWFEKTPSCVAFAEYLKLVAKFQNIYLPIDFIKVDNRPDAKKVRIGAITGLLRYKKLKFLVGLPIWEKLVTQSEQFTGDRNSHDDYPDTLALMIQQFSGVALAMPARPNYANFSNNPILAMIAQREQDTAHIMDEPDPSDGVDEFIAF
jgi:hypothetical protein